MCWLLKWQFHSRPFSILFYFKIFYKICSLNNCSFVLIAKCLRPILNFAPGHLFLRRKRWPLHHTAAQGVFFNLKKNARRFLLKHMCCRLNFTCVTRILTSNGSYRNTAIISNSFLLWRPWTMYIKQRWLDTFFSWEMIPLKVKKNYFLWRSHRSIVSRDVSVCSFLTPAATVKAHCS
jgi:hypothetical protein